MVKMREQLIPIGTKRRSGIPLNTTSRNMFFVDHDTGNANSTAQNNVTYYINSKNDMSASAHVFVDDIEVIICIPCLLKPEKAWHVQYDKVKDNAMFGDDANDIAIGLEMCYFPNDKARTLKSYQNYVDFAAYLANYHGADPSRRAGHFELDPQRRTDPNNALKYIGKTYSDMKKDIIDRYNEVYLKKDEEAKVVNVVSESCKNVLNSILTNPSEWITYLSINTSGLGIYFDELIEKVYKNRKRDNAPWKVLIERNALQVTDWINEINKAIAEDVYPMKYAGLLLEKVNMAK